MKIQNRTKTIQVFNIPCRNDCDGENCLCSNVTTPLQVVDVDGVRGQQILERRLPGALTFLAGAVCEVPDWAAETKPIKDAMAKNVLRLVKE